MNSVTFRKQQVERRRQQQQRKNMISLVIGVAGVLLLGAGIYFYIQQKPGAEAATNYTEEDVAREAPFVAEHEMGAGPPIPFLPAGEPQPRIALSETRYDFGRIGPQDVVEHTVIVHNDGQAPLTISRAYTTCGCTVAEFSASVIPPGKVATVRVIFDAGFHDTAGQTVRRGIIIENNDPNQSQAEIWVQAAVNLK
ncbi:MAG TPA: DUF1573 domain-containing protein [Candidatus Sulfomarinibacteraceae bacterium]|nr:DUF1573 domain-containing protein [Candidatus Sulfomarinibacteraceae bacterium]